MSYGRSFSFNLKKQESNKCIHPYWMNNLNYVFVKRKLVLNFLFYWIGLLHPKLIHVGFVSHSNHNSMFSWSLNVYAWIKLILLSNSMNNIIQLSIQQQILQIQTLFCYIRFSCNFTFQGYGESLFFII